MSDQTPTTLRAVPGEMQPWTDLGEPTGPVRGPVVLRWLDEVLPRGGRWLVAGPHDAAVLRLALGRADAVTLLLRSPSDAETVRGLVPEDLDIVVGALDALPSDGPQHDVVVAVDGLDRLLTPDSAELSWRERLGLVHAQAAPEAVVVLGLGNELSMTGLLDARVARDRHGDEEWMPIHSDPERPTSAAQLAQALGSVGRTPTSLWATFGPGARPWLLATVEVTDAARADHFVANAAAVAARSTSAPLLALPDEALSSAARAGALTTVADGFLVVTGPAVTPAAQVYAAASPESAWSARFDATGERPTWLVTRPAGDERGFPDAPTVESELRRLAEREDVPAFRAYAGRLGSWALDRPASTSPLTFDRLVTDGDTFTEVVATAALQDEAEPTVALTAAWFRFQDRLLREHRRHPWPPWVLGQDLVTIWSSMSGVTVTPAELASGRAVADELADPTPEVVDVRTAIADAAETAKQLFEARGHIAGLERTIGFRDKQLLTREKKIRKLHSDLQKVEKIRNHPAYKALRKASKARDPKKIASLVKKKAAQELRRRR